MTDDPNRLDETQAFEEDDLEGAREDDLEPEEGDEEADEGEEAEEAAAPVAPSRRPGRGGAPAGMGGPRRQGAPAPGKPTRAKAVVLDPSLRIRDRVSEIFVIGTLVVFLAIFANALAFGHGGAFSAVPTPAPTSNASLGPNPSAAPSSSPAASPTAAPAATPSETPGASPAAS